MRDCGPRDWKRVRNEEAMGAADGSGGAAVEKRRLGRNRGARRTGRRVMVKLAVQKHPEVYKRLDVVVR